MWRCGRRVGVTGEAQVAAGAIEGFRRFPTTGTQVPMIHGDRVAGAVLQSSGGQGCDYDAAVVHADPVVHGGRGSIVNAARQHARQ